MSSDVENEVRIHSRYLSAECRIGGRSFIVGLLRFGNGGFVDISEGDKARIGAISVCVKANQGVTSTSLVPDRRGGIFAQLVGELVSKETGGLTIVSLHLKQEIDSDITKKLLSQVRALSSRKDLTTPT